MAVRNIKFQYFRMGNQKDGKESKKTEENFSFTSWLQFVSSNGIEQQTVQLNDTKARIEKIRYFEDAGVWIIRFMKLREENLPYIAKENADAEGIPLEPDEYIGEDLYMLYDTKNHIAMVQVNRFSLGLSRLAEFFEKTCGIDGVHVHFYALSNSVDLKKFHRNMYRTIELGFANIKRDIKGDGNDTLGDILNGFKKFSSVSGTIKISIGRSKHDTLDATEANRLINNLSDYDNIVSAKVKVKDDDDSRVEVVDLFENVLCDILSFNLGVRETLSFDYTARSMIATYVKSKSKIKRLIKVE